MPEHVEVEMRKVSKSATGSPLRRPAISGEVCSCIWAEVRRLRRCTETDMSARGTLPSERERCV
jgi:hypothetical protein